MKGKTIYIDFEYYDLKLTKYIKIYVTCVWI